MGRRASDELAADHPISLAVSQRQLEAAISTGRGRLFAKVVATSLLTAMVIAALIGLFGVGFITRTVRSDVQRAAVRNCNRTNQEAAAGPAVRQFLASDAALNHQAAKFGNRTARIQADLGKKLAQLGPAVPPAIAKDFAELSHTNHQLARSRDRAARLWDGPEPAAGPSPGKPKSLAAQVLLVNQISCDDILTP